MTKNYESSDEHSEKMAPSNPQSPQDQVMDFINTLGEHMEEAFSHPAQQNEKDGDGPSGNPPDYATSEKGEPSNNGNRSNERREGPFGRGGPWGGPWNANWRENWREQAGQTHPWAAMASMFANPENFGPGGAFPFGPGGHGGPGGPGGRGRGGFGGRGGYHGPWGWQSRRWGKGPHCHRGGNNDQEFIPAVDIFDTPDSFVVHIALAGALKEDIGINYDFDNAELQVSGVVHRPGDEEFLKHLVDGERRVGAFDRKIKLESNGKTVAVDADAITAKMENGLLEVTVPKLRKADEPEKKKISIA